MGSEGATESVPNVVERDGERGDDDANGANHVIRIDHTGDRDGGDGVDALSDRPDAAMCAQHPERRASITCPHCGSYACGDCTVDTLWGDVMCEDCLAHGRAQYPLPWEHALSPVSFVQSAYLLFAEALHAFRHFPEGTTRRALAFALSVGVVLALLSGTTEWLFAPHHWAVDAPGPLAVIGTAMLRVVPATLGFVLLTSASFHGAATLLGGRTRFAVSLRAACYLSVIQLLEVANIVLDTILMGSAPVTIIIRLVGLFFLVWGLSLVGEHRFALPRSRAIAAAATPALLLLALLVGLVVAVAWLRPAG